MSQKAKDTNKTIMIGRDANGTEIRIDFYEIYKEISNQVNQQFNNCQKEFDKFSTKSDVESLTKKIEKLETNVDDISDSKKKYNPMNWIVAIFGLSFLFFLFTVFLNKTYDFGLSGDSIVLAFVGIAATFVVVSNYAQVQEIKNEFKTKLKEVKDEFSTQINQIKELNNRVVNLEKRAENINIENRVEFYYSINNAQFYFVSNDYTKSYESYSSAFYYLHELNKNGGCFKYDKEISEKLDMLFKHSKGIKISNERKKNDIKLIEMINNNDFSKYKSIIEKL